MTTATLDKIRQQLTDGHYNSVNTEELIELPVKLYTPEVVHAAAQKLGKKTMPDYYIEMYEFAFRAQAVGNGVKPAQADGVMRSHDAISKWLKTQNIVDVCNMQDPDVMRIYLAYHLSNMKAAVKAFEEIAAVLGGN